MTDNLRIRVSDILFEEEALAQSLIKEGYSDEVAKKIATQEMKKKYT